VQMDGHLGRYRYERHLGTGGMAEVYEVSEPAGGRRLALKQLSRRYAADARRILSFKHEFHACARLRHPCVVEVYEYGVADGVPYYTMELLADESLRDRCPLPHREACELLRDIAAALAFLHARGVVHRDVSLGNLQRSTAGRAKLIDFGIMATAGASAEVAGTPPYIAPETLRRQEVDHRADLFGLGALAYLLLTGQHAFSVRKLADLEEAWRQPPMPVAEVVPDVPPALSDLISSLLAIDRLARPAHAAAVVDVLEGIAELAPLPGVDLTVSWLASAALVGRHSEMAVLSDQVSRLLHRNKGGAVVIEAPSGTGKSRLMREAALEAQTSGATVVQVHCSQAVGPYEVLRRTAVALLELAREHVATAARPQAGLLARALPELAQLWPDLQIDLPLGDAQEDRLRLQNALTEWLSKLAEHVPLTIWLDDVQRCDEASLAAFAAIARSPRGCPLLVCAGWRTDEAVRAPAPLSALAATARQLQLAGISRAEVERLVVSQFGDVPGVAPLAEWIHHHSAGSPMQCHVLARHLVDAGAIRHAHGLWVLPPSLDGYQPPANLGAALDDSVAALSPAARRLGQGLAVHGGDLPVDLCVDLGAGNIDEVFAALDELEQAGVVVRAGPVYRFGHDSAREALLRSMDDAASVQIHGRVAAAIEARGLGPDREGELGRHLVRAGQTRRGASLLHRAGARLIEQDAAADALPLLEEALAAYQRSGGRRRDVLAVQRMLIMSAAVVNRDVFLRHADATLAALYEHTGLARARRLARVVGWRAAIGCSVLVEQIRWLLARPSRRGPFPLLAIRDWVIACAYAGSAYLSERNMAGLERLVDETRPLAGLGIAALKLLHNMARMYLNFNVGKLRETEEYAAQTVRAATRLSSRLVLADIDARMAQGMAHVLRDAVHAYDGAPLTGRQEVEALDLRVFDLASRQVQAVALRVAGNERAALQLEREIQVLALQAGTSWQLDALRHMNGCIVYGDYHDVVGLKRTLDGLERQVEQGYSFATMRDTVRAELLRQRGRPDEACRLFEQVIAAYGTEIHAPRHVALAGLAEAQLAAGDAAGAIATAQWASQLVGFRICQLRVIRCQALAEAQLGQVDRAVSRIDRALADTEPLAVPAMLGLLHETRAQLALRAGDRDAFAIHLAAMNRWLRPTGNPALIARIDRLTQSGRGAAQRGSAPPWNADSDVTQTSAVDVGAGAPTATLLTEATLDPDELASRLELQWGGASDPAGCALELLIADSGGAAGHLYRVDGQGYLDLVALSPGARPDPMVRQAAAQIATREATTGELSESVRSSSSTRLDNWLMVALVCASTTAPIGIAAIQASARPVRRPRAQLCSAVARWLNQAPQWVASRPA
jgi:tRNA A-37 threonylcarbamoyl transferase component Bud32